MTFRQAEMDEFDRVRGFYWALIDVMEGGRFDPGWRKGIYPSDAELGRSLSHRELYVLEEGGRIIAAVIINNECNLGYEGLPWRVDAPAERVFMLHALGVAPDRQGQGVAGRVVSECLAAAREKGAGPKRAVPEKAAPPRCKHRKSPDTPPGRATEESPECRRQPWIFPLRAVRSS